MRTETEHDASGPDDYVELHKHELDELAELRHSLHLQPPVPAEGGEHPAWREGYPYDMSDVLMYWPRLASSSASRFSGMMPSRRSRRHEA